MAAVVSPAESTQITSQTTNIPGLVVFAITMMRDERGYFQEKFEHAKLVHAGLPESFVQFQTNITYSKQAGVTRGAHAEPWNKFVSVVNGRVFFAAIDLRAGESFGNIFAVEINPEVAVFVPHGVAASYQVLTDDCYYYYSIDHERTPALLAQARYVNVGDPALGIQWPIPLDQAVLSDKDRGHPLLAAVKPIEE